MLCEPYALEMLVNVRGLPVAGTVVAFDTLKPAVGGPAAGATTDVAADVAVCEPTPLVAVTATRSVSPTSFDPTE